MSNIIDFLDDGFDDEEMETDEVPKGNRTVDIQTSESKQGDLGDEIRGRFLCPLLIQRSPCQAQSPICWSWWRVHGCGGSASPVCIPPPVLAVCMLVSVWSHLLECAPSQISQQCLFCGALPTPHPGSQDARCVTRRCFCPPKLPSLTPKWLLLIGCLDEIAQNQLREVS